MHVWEDNGGIAWRNWEEAGESREREREREREKGKGKGSDTRSDIAGVSRPPSGTRRGEDKQYKKPD